jgi:hypothetical protein
VRWNGAAYTTTDVAQLGKRMAVMAGWEGDTAGGKLWRIGGATDLWNSVGPAAARAHMKQRGRWKTDIWELYQRALLGEALDAAAGMADANDQDIESMWSGYAQPA